MEKVWRHVHSFRNIIPQCVVQTDRQTCHNTIALCLPLTCWRAICTCTRAVVSACKGEMSGCFYTSTQRLLPMQVCASLLSKASTIWPPFRCSGIFFIVRAETAAIPRKLDVEAGSRPRQVHFSIESGCLVSRLHPWIHPAPDLEVFRLFGPTVFPQIYAPHVPRSNFSRSNCNKTHWSSHSSVLHGKSIEGHCLEWQKKTKKGPRTNNCLKQGLHIIL